MFTTRRRYLAGLGLTAAGATLGAAALPGAGLAAAQPEPPEPPEPLALTARRTEINLPGVPALGLAYICRLDLFDPDGGQVGTAAAGATMVSVTLEGPVVLASVVLQLAAGEIHYQRIMDRFGEFPRAATGAILGGTGGYAGIGGEVDISWPDEDRVDLLVRPA